MTMYMIAAVALGCFICLGFSHTVPQPVDSGLTNYSDLNSNNDPSMLDLRQHNRRLTTTTRPHRTTAKTCGRPVVPPSANPNVMDRIVNGVNSARGAFPWACAMVDNQGSPFQYCGCTLISDQWVMTAGHCVADNTESYIQRTTTIYLGVNDLRQASRKNGTILSIARVFKNPAYTSGIPNNDVALIKLATRVALSPYLSPACLPTAPITSSAPQVDSTGRRVCYVSGWGTLSQKQAGGGVIGSGSDTLKQTSLEIYPVSTCAELEARQGIKITDKMICAGYDRGGFDSCQGDSGGGLVCEERNQSWSVHGIVSFGAGCAQPNDPGVYSNVFNLEPFIENTIANN